MSENVHFENTAESAVGLMNCLLDAGKRQGRREQIPSLIELQTICREAGCDLVDLNVFARVRDKGPALLLCGGDSLMAMEIAKQIGYTLEIPELPDTPLVWCADNGEKAGLVLRNSDAERAISPRMLITFLQGEHKLTDFVFIEERVKTRTPWRFMWLPQPKYLEEFENSAGRIEILLGQQAAVTVNEDTPQSVIDTLNVLEQKWWPIARDQWQEEIPRAKLLGELPSLLEETEETRELRAISLWQFVSERMLSDVEHRKHDYEIAIQQHEHKVRHTRQTLGQYQRNWTNGVRNVIETYFQQRTAGRAFADFWDPQKAGPDVDTFLAAIVFPNLQTRIEHFVTDRLAEFVAGLSGLAIKLELRRITLGEMEARWNPRGIEARLENRLRDQRIFSDGGGKRSGIMAKVTGKTQGIVDQRKEQVAHACRDLSQAVNAEFSEWCMGFITGLEQNIRIQLAAGLANQGLPDMERLRGALSGFDRLSDRIRHHRAANRTSEDIAAEWLRLLASRRWIPLFQSPSPLPTAR